MAEEVYFITGSPSEILVDPSTGSPIKDAERESKPFTLQPIKRPDVTHILSKVSCFLLKFFHFRRLQKRYFFPIQILTFRNIFSRYNSTSSPGLFPQKMGGEGKSPGDEVGFNSGPEEG